jgi:hypothetical protein
MKFGSRWSEYNPFFVTTKKVVINNLFSLSNFQYPLCKLGVLRRPIRVFHCKISSSYHGEKFQRVMVVPICLPGLWELLPVMLG